MNKTTITNAKLFEEDGKYYLSLTATKETNKDIREIKIPRIIMPFTKNATLDINTTVYERETPFWTPIGVDFRDRYTECKISFGDTAFPIEEKNGVAYVEKVIKEKTQELTLEEIERRLGYKVKIVSGGKK